MVQFPFPQELGAAAGVSEAEARLFDHEPAASDKEEKESDDEAAESDVDEFANLRNLIDDTSESGLLAPDDETDPREGGTRLEGYAFPWEDIPLRSESEWAKADIRGGLHAPAPSISVVMTSICVA